MRYLWLFALFAGHAAFAADDDARRCDAAGADAFDPLRPADVPFRYYHPFYADVAAMKADVAACQRAFAASKDPRYFYQAGMILSDATSAQDLRYIAAGEAPAVADGGMAMLSLGAYQAAADAGYATARYRLLLLPQITENKQAFDDLRKDMPLLGDFGLAQWYEHQERLAPERKAEWRALRKQHLQAVAEAGSAHGKLALARLLMEEGEMAQAHSLLQALIAADAQNLLAQDTLALFYFNTGDTAAGEALLAGVQQRAEAGDADAQVFTDYWRGLRLLNGWGVETDETAATALLQAAARSGHRGAQLTLLAKKQPW
ncbi:hypothetical protein [uncultured Cardiobacterium sp.]|uniref:hypothetical protein n=1 Tax=uncultured Cardiobacterium sp. TaxID=417619 RepID=UPI002623A61E|nr:hypothetical protein [uncultured Cardiobacterium sp.]